MTKPGTLSTRSSAAISSARVRRSMLSGRRHQRCLGSNAAEISEMEITARIRTGRPGGREVHLTCFRLARGNRTAQRLCRTQSDVRNTISTALQKNQVTDTDVEKFLRKGARSIAQKARESCMDDARADGLSRAVATRRCLYSSEVREQVRRSMGREENVTDLEVDTLVREGAQQSAARALKSCIKNENARTFAEKRACVFEVARVLKNKLGRENNVTAVEASEFAREGTFGVAADYMAACVAQYPGNSQRNRTLRRQCRSKKEVREAIAGSLGRNATDVQEEDFEAIVQKGAERAGANTVSACIRSKATAQEKRECVRNDEAIEAVRQSLGRDDVPERDVVRAVKKGLRRQAVSVMQACKTTRGNSSSCLRLPEVLHNLRETLGKPNASLVDVRIELREAAKLKAAEVRQACADVESSSDAAATKRCRINTDVKRAIAEGLGKDEVDDDEVEEVLQAGEATDAADKVLKCKDQGSTQERANCRTRIRTELTNSGAAADSTEAEVVLKRGIEDRASSTLRACMGEDANRTTVRRCMQDVIADAKAALGDGGLSRRMLRNLDRRLSQATLAHARKVTDRGSRRSSAEAITECSRTKREEGSSVDQCVAPTSSTRTCERTRARQRRPPRIASELLKTASALSCARKRGHLRRRAHGTAASEPQPFTSTEKEAKRKQVRADAAGRRRPRWRDPQEAPRSGGEAGVRSRGGCRHRRGVQGRWRHVQRRCGGQGVCSRKRKSRLLDHDGRQDDLHAAAGAAPSQHWSSSLRPARRRASYADCIAEIRPVTDQTRGGSTHQAEDEKQAGRVVIGQHLRCACRAGNQKSTCRTRAQSLPAECGSAPDRGHG